MIVLLDLGVPVLVQSQPVLLGDEFQVNTFVTDRQRYAAVSSDTDGDFVVVWESNTQDGDLSGVFGQRYQSSGAALGDEFQVNTYVTSNQVSPAVSSESNGDFVVVWHSNGQDGSSNGIFGQRYQSSGVALGDEFQVNPYVTGNQNNVAVSSDADGDFVVVWQGAAQDGSNDGIFGQRYPSSGAALGDEFQVNTFTTASQRLSEKLSWQRSSMDRQSGALTPWPPLPQGRGGIAENSGSRAPRPSGRGVGVRA
jgi:hypothetical protein